MVDVEWVKGIVDVEVICLCGLVEVEVKEKLVEVFQKFGEVVVFDIIVKMLFEFVGKIVELILFIDKLMVVDIGKGEGVVCVSNYVIELMFIVFEMLKSVLGIDVEQLIKGLIKFKILVFVVVQ